MITTAGPFTVAEGTTAVATLAATDGDTAVDQLNWTITTGADADKFTLSAAGVLAFSAARDYENLDDADGDGSYEVTVQVSDGDDDATTDVTVTVTNVDEPGSVSLFPAGSLVGTVVRATLEEPDGGVGPAADHGTDRVIWSWASSSDKSDWNNISGASGASYTPVGGDMGMWLRASAAYTDDEGPGKSADAVSESIVGERAPAPDLSVFELVSAGVTLPWGIAFTLDGTMLFTERPGKLSSRLADGTIQEIEAGLTTEDSDFATGRSTGMKAIVVDPDFATNRRFYTCQGYKDPDGPNEPKIDDVRVIAWTINDGYTEATRVNDPLVSGLAARADGYHGGCRMRFGPDGYLWIATGDGGQGANPQNLSSLGGKILRVDAATGAGAPGNPFSEAPLIYTYGHRNMQGLALRPGTRQMWSVEHGPTVDDEINLLAAGGNYGWDPARLDENERILYSENAAPMTDLVKFPDAIEAQWSSGYPSLATSGAIFLEGEQWGEWEGRLAVATLINQSLRIFEFDADGVLVSHVVPPELYKTYGRLRTPMLGPDQALYISTDAGSNKILRVTPQ